MKEWKLDCRTSGDIIRSIKETAANYTPEWHFDPEEADIGSALAFVYADMLEGTAKEFNRIGYKNQLAFFNSLGAELGRAVPASGYGVFRIPEDAPEGTEIPAHTGMTADLDDEEGGSAQFETVEDLYATPAKPICLYMTDKTGDGIYQIAENLPEQTEPLILFRKKGENLQAHELYLAHEEVLGIFGEGYVEISFFAGNGQLLDAKLMEVFTDPESARFSYWSEEGWQPFEKASLLHGKLLLRKRAGQRPFAKLELGEINTYVVRCEILDINKAESISVEEIRLQSRGDRLSPQSIYGASVECSSEEFFPFGDRLSLFEEVYFGSGEALSKRGAQVSLSFQLDYIQIPLETGLGENEIEWKWVMKRSDFRPDPEYDVTIEEVIWEYFNGSGWSRLFPDKEYSDVFSARQGALSQQKTITFTCPMDMMPILVNSCETCYIRARILKINNLYKMKGKYIIPVLGNTLFSYAYRGMYRHPEMVCRNNNLEQKLFTGKQFMETKEAGKLFEGLEASQKALYLGFERPPEGAPVRMLLMMEDTLLGQRGSLSWEYYSRKGFREMNLADGTRSLSRTGLVTFVGQEDFCKIRRFGREMYWIRLRDESDFFAEDLNRKHYPVLKGLWMNAAQIRHMEREETESFTLEYYEENVAFTLMHGNIDEITVEVLGENREEALWETWRESVDLEKEPAGSKVYQVDRIAGVVRFGNGSYGQVPTFGREEGIRIRYKCGGGSRANVGPGQVNKLNQTVGFVTGVENPESLWGGLDAESPREALQRCSARLRHRGRAVTASDYEELAKEASRSLNKVRCFGGRNELGEREAGAVTLVILPDSSRMDKSQFYAVQKTIYSYLSSRMDPGILVRKQFYIVSPKLVEVRVMTEVVVGSFQDVFQVRRRIQDRIRGFLDPMEGHFDGKGWNIGQFPNAMQIQNALKEIPEIVQIQKVYLVTFINGPKGREEVEPEVISRHPYVLPVSGNHEVLVKVQQ